MALGPLSEAVGLKLVVLLLATRLFTNLHGEYLAVAPRKGNIYSMNWLQRLLSCLLVLAGLGHAISSTGNRLLVVIEEAAEKVKYSKFWGDLEGEHAMSRLIRLARLISKIYSKRLQDNFRIAQVGKAIAVSSWRKVLRPYRTSPSQIKRSDLRWRSCVPRIEES